MRIPFAHVDAENERLLGELRPQWEALLTSGSLIGGDEVARFEQDFAAMQETRHAIAVNSGTDALRLTLRALGIPRGSVGITVANTFVATVGALVSEGLRPLLVDVGEDENINPGAVRDAITPDTGVVIAVHLRGWPARVDTLRDLCAEHGIPLVEDCAQAVCATLGGRPVGGFGAAGCFSLHPLKNLAACGDGGAIVTDDDALASELRLLRNHGLSDRETVARWGENSRLDALQAAVLNVKMRHLPEWTGRRAQLAALYQSGLANLPLVLPPSGGDRTHVYHRYSIRSTQRDALRDHLAAAGVQTAIHYPVPIHWQPAALHGGIDVAQGGLSITEQQSGEILSLPLHPVTSEHEIEYVIEQVIGFHK